MLTTPSPVPPNSTSPLPADWGNRNAASIFNIFAAGLMNEPNSPCPPGPDAFSDLSPAGTLFPFITVNEDQPALSSAVLAPSAVSPLASQVYQVQASQRQSLTSNNASLAAAVDGAGQQGAGSDDWGDAAEVYPMSTTANMVTERTPVNQRHRRRGPPRNTNSPGVPWGGVPVNIPAGGCQPGLSGWAKVFLLAGAVAVVYMATE